MFSFFQDLLEFRFLQFSLLAAFLCSLACGTIGSFVVVRKSTYIVGAISHSIMGGLGIARYLKTVMGIEWMTPTVGALLAAIVSAFVISYFSLQNRERIDTVLSAIWALGMALGISFLVATPGYGEDLMSYLFGDILMVNQTDLWIMLLLNVVIITLVITTFEKLLVTSFNPQLAKLKGLNVALYESLFIILTALTVVALIRVVGIILVIALMSIPAATAAKLTQRLASMVLVSIGFCLLYTFSGLMISYHPNLPVGPTIIEIGVLVYGIVSVIALLKQRPKKEG